jgi:hypothetical protein
MTDLGLTGREDSNFKKLAGHLEEDLGPTGGVISRFAISRVGGSWLWFSRWWWFAFYSSTPVVFL